YRVWIVHAEGDVHADEAQRTHELLRTGIRRQRAGRRAAELCVFRGGAERHMADQETRWRRGEQRGREDAERRGEETGRYRQIDELAGGSGGRGQGGFRSERNGGAFGTEIGAGED